MDSFSIKIQKTAFFSTIGQPDDTITDFWFVLHGYGQLSKYFIRHFAGLEKPGAAIIAPEAPSRFYLDATYGRVGASWMTKHEREADIEDLNVYLDSVFEETCSRFSVSKNTRFRFLGFSQGVPVLCRWLTRRRNIPFHQLILWAGTLPTDMAISDIGQLLSKGKSFAVYGTQDPYLKDGQFLSKIASLSDGNLPIEVLSFSGEHTLDATVLEQLANL